jgi:DNA-binding response OmpR family regulator
MSTSPRILSVSYDAALLQTRKTLLEAQGYWVLSAEGITDALKQCQSGSFDLVIIGHSIPHNDKKALHGAVRQSCNAPVLALLRTDEPPLEGAAASIDPMNASEFLLTVRELTKG